MRVADVRGVGTVAQEQGELTIISVPTLPNG